MKVLTVRQPWASLIVQGHKDIENRSRRTHYRGPLLIQASASIAPEREWRGFLDALGFDVDVSKLPTGGLIGMCHLVDCVDDHHSEWFHGPFGYVLTKQRKLPFIKMRGQLSMFDPPRHVLRRLKQQTQSR